MAAGGPSDSAKAGGEVGNIALQSGEQGQLRGKHPAPACCFVVVVCTQRTPSLMRLLHLFLQRVLPNQDSQQYTT